MPQPCVFPAARPERPPTDHGKGRPWAPLHRRAEFPCIQGKIAFYGVGSTSNPYQIFLYYKHLRSSSPTRNNSGNFSKNSGFNSADSQKNSGNISPPLFSFGGQTNSQPAKGGAQGQATEIPRSPRVPRKRPGPARFCRRRCIRIRPGSSAPPCTARGASATSTRSRAVHPICGASRRAAASRRIARGEPTIAAAPCPSRASPFGRSLAVTGVRAEERGAEPIANSRIVTLFSRPALTPLSGIDATLNTTSPTVISATRATTRWSRLGCYPEYVG